MTSIALYNLPHPQSHPSLSSTRPACVTIPTRSRSVSVRASSVDSTRLESSPSFYELLGIPTDVSLGEIKQAYRHMARKYHPDVSPRDRVEEYTERFIRVQEAYETLSDPERRAMYDGDLTKGLNLAFSVRRRGDENMDLDKSEWRNRWQSQLSELKRRSMYKNARGYSSWGAKMPTQASDSSNEV